MKKETVSVLKPHNGKKSKSKEKKVSKKNAGKVQKKVASPRVAQKPKIVNVEQVNNDQMKELKDLIMKQARLSSKKSLVEDTLQNGKKKNSPKNSPVAGKMAAVRKDRDETRGQPKKKLKTHAAEETTVAVKKEKKDNKPAVKKENKAEVKKENKAAVKKENKAAVKKENRAPVKKEHKVNATIKSPKAKGSKKSKKIIIQKSRLSKYGSLKLTKEHVLNSIDAVLTMQQKKMESKKSLLPIESAPIFIQVSSMKVASGPRRHIRPLLPHSMVGPMDDVVLFVSDLVKGRNQDFEKTVDHWETLLRQKGVDCIKEIIPINQVRTEYGQYEMKRKLAASFDYHLADGKIIGHLTHLLGKPFLHRCNAPTPVKLNRDDLKAELDTALRKGLMEVHPYGNCQTMKVGTVSMDKEKVAENILAACKVLAAEYPGGWDNIRAVQVKGQNTMAIPIYINLSSKNTIKVPVVAPKRPRAYETVEGELSTLPGKATVKVTPEGKITVKRERDQENRVKEEVAKESEEENEEVAEESEEENEEVAEESEEENEEAEEESSDEDED